MSAVDLVILLCLGVAGVHGLVAGFMRSTSGIAAIASGILVAGRGWPWLLPAIQRWITQEAIAKWVSVIILAGATTLLADWILQRFRRILEGGVLGMLNHVAGASFNVLFVGLLLGIGLLVMEEYGNDAIRSYITHSSLGPILVTLARHLLGLAQPILPTQAHPNWLTA